MTVIIRILKSADNSIQHQIYR